MLKKDCHLHPNILKEPAQAENFVARAIALGFDEICFTDHMPLSVRPDDYDRIEAGKVGLYCERVAELAEKYKEVLTVKTGIEVDYFPGFEEEIDRVLSSGKFDYIIGSSHLGIRAFGILDKPNLDKISYAKTVIENNIAAAKTGLFNTIAHPDVYRVGFVEYNIPGEFNYTDVLDEMKEYFSTLEKTGVNLEINAAGLYKKLEGGAYPQNELLNIAADYNLSYVYGSDAHVSDKVGYEYDRFKYYLL